MDESEDLLPDDDSVFDAVINDSQHDCSDALLEDSFSSISDMQNVSFVASTPIPSKGASGDKRGVVSGPLPSAVSSPRRGRGAARSATPEVSSPRRGRSAARAPTDEVSSPRRGRSAARPGTPEVPSPRRGRSAARPETPEVPSPRRGRSAARPGTPEVPSPRRSRSGAGPASVESTVRRASTSRQSATRLKCPECPSTLANERTMAVHKKSHALKRAFARAPGPQDFLEKLPILIQNSLNKILDDPLVGKWAEPLKTFTRLVLETFMDLTEEHDFIFKFLHEHFYPILSCHSAIFSSSLVHTFHVGVNSLLNNIGFRTEFKKHFVALVEVETPCSEVINVFLGSTIFHLSTEVLLYFIKTIHGATANDEIRRKRSADAIDSRDFLELVYYIGGSVVSVFLFKSNKFKESNRNWNLFYDVLITKFCRVDAVGSACADNVRLWTEKKDRGGLKHISQGALDFFVVLFDFLMSKEGEDGSLPKDVVDIVLKDDTILCLWDVLVGTNLEEDLSLDFLMQMTTTCSRIVMKGIIKRKLNQNLKKAFAAVSLRSRLAD